MWKVLPSKAHSCYSRGLVDELIRVHNMLQIYFMCGIFYMPITYNIDKTWGVRKICFQMGYDVS